MKAIIDTSVFIAYLICGRSVHTWLMHHWHEHRFSVVISPAIFSEIADVSSRPNISSRINPDVRLSLLRQLRQQAIWTPGEKDAEGTTPDPKDDMLVSAALESEAEFIVTWDKALSETQTSGTVRFINPEQFVALLMRS